MVRRLCGSNGPRNQLVFAIQISHVSLNGGFRPTDRLLSAGGAVHHPVFPLLPTAARTSDQGKSTHFRPTRIPDFHTNQRWVKNQCQIENRCFSSNRILNFQKVCVAKLKQINISNQRLQHIFKSNQSFKVKKIIQRTIQLFMLKT